MDCFKVSMMILFQTSLMFKTSGSIFQLKNQLNINAGSLELLNLPDLAPIIHKWQKTKSLVAS